MANQVHIDVTVCKGCKLCIYYCPRNVFTMSEVHNEKGYNIVEVDCLEQCTGCKLCEISCPDFAIYIEKS